MTNLQQISIFLDNSSKQALADKKEELIFYPLLLAFFLRPNEDGLWLCLNKTNYRGVWTNFVDNNSNFHPTLYKSSLGAGRAWGFGAQLIYLLYN